MGRKHKPLAGRSGGSANQPSRDRRDSQADALTPMAFPLRVNSKGQLELLRHSRGALGVDPSQGLFIIVHAPLKLMPGSPYGIAIEHDDTLSIINQKLSSSPSTRSVRDGQSTLDQTILRLQTNKENKSEKDQVLGYPSLDATGVIPLAEIPAGAAPGGVAGGDLTGTYPNPTLGHSVVLLTNMANVVTGSVFYRKTAGSGIPEIQTLATLKTDLGLIGTNSGDQTITLTGNVTGSGTGSFVTTIAASAVTLAMQANMATASLVYRKTAGSGAPEVQTLATLKTDLGLTGTNSGDQTITLTGDTTGSGTGSFATTVVKASGSFALPGDISPTQITSDQNNYNPTGLSTAATIRLTTDAPRTITGLQGGADGRILTIHNVGAQTLLLASNSASSSAANRFKFNNSPLTVGADTCCVLQYDSTTSFWRVLAVSDFLAPTGFVALDSNNLATVSQMPYEHGIATLSGSSVTVPSTLMSLGYTCNVILTRVVNISGVPGDLKSDRSEDTGTDFVVRSNGVSDKCDFTYLVLAT